MILISSFNKSSEDKKIESFFSNIKFGRFLADPDLDFRQSLKTEIAIFQEYHKTNNVYFVIEKNEILGLIGFRKSGWDSDHFDFGVCKLDYFLLDEENSENQLAAKLLMEPLNEWVQENRIKLIVAKIDSSFSKISMVLQKKNFIFYECITYRSLKDPELVASQFDNLVYRFANLNDRSQLRSIAENNTFEKSHFYLDEEFEKEKVDAMYTKWIETALSEQSKNRILVIEENNEIAGMFIYSLPRHPQFPNLKFSKFEFLAINKKFRKKGLGKKLFEAAIHSSVKDGANIIDSTLVDKNIISQKIHEKYNFGLVNTFYTFHKWFKNN